MSYLVLTLLRSCHGALSPPKILMKRGQMQEIVESYPHGHRVLIYSGSNHAKTRLTGLKKSACSLPRRWLGRDVKSLEVRARAGGEACGTLKFESSECGPYPMKSYPYLKEPYRLSSPIRGEPVVFPITELHHGFLIYCSLVSRRRVVHTTGDSSLPTDRAKAGRLIS